MNIKVRDLKAILNKCHDDMDVVIPSIDASNVNHLQSFYHARTVGILYNGTEESQHVLCINTSTNWDVDLSDQISQSNRKNIVCERVLYPADYHPNDGTKTSLYKTKE